MVFDIHELGARGPLTTVAMLVVLDQIFNRIARNRAAGRPTVIMIDEIYLLYANEYSANFLYSLWKRVRKMNAMCTGLSQNIEDLLQSYTARTMLSNSEFVIMLNQAASDREELAKLLDISETQLGYVTNVPAGRGLIKAGPALVPFENVIPKDTQTYRLLSTKPGEFDTAA